MSGLPPGYPGNGNDLDSTGGGNASANDLFGSSATYGTSLFDSAAEAEMAFKLSSGRGLLDVEGSLTDSENLLNKVPGTGFLWTQRLKQRAEMDSTGSPPDVGDIPQPKKTSSSFMAYLEKTAVVQTDAG